MQESKGTPKVADNIWTLNGSTFTYIVQLSLEGREATKYLE